MLHFCLYIYTNSPVKEFRQKIHKPKSLLEPTWTNCFQPEVPKYMFQIKVPSGIASRVPEGSNILVE